MSDSSFASVSSHRSCLASSSLSSSSLSCGHPFVPPGRSNVLDVVDDEWASQKLNNDELDLRGAEARVHHTLEGEEDNYDVIFIIRPL